MKITVRIKAVGKSLIVLESRRSGDDYPSGKIGIITSLVKKPTFSRNVFSRNLAFSHKIAL